jgi:hypothetical protein
MKIQLASGSLVLISFHTSNLHSMLNFSFNRPKFKTGGIIPVKETQQELYKRESRQLRFQTGATTSPPPRQFAGTKRSASVGNSSVMLILENIGTYHSIRALTPVAKQ